MSDERLFSYPPRRIVGKPVPGRRGWKQVDAYYCESATHTVCKVFMDTRPTYEAWRKGNRVMDAVRLGIYTTSKEAFDRALSDKLAMDA